MIARRESLKLSNIESSTMSREPNPASTRSFEPLSLGSTIDLLDLLWRRKRMLAAGLLAAGLLGLAYYFFLPPTYESSASVLLVQKRPEVVTGDPQYESSFEDYVATHRALIVSPLIIKRAVETADLRSLTTFTGLDPEWELLEMLTVHAGPRDLGENADSIMTLVYEGPVAEECPVIVQAVVDSYRSFLDETYRDMSDDTMKLIGEARDVLKNDLQAQEDAYVTFRQASPLVTRGTDEVNPLQDRLAAIESQRTALLIRRTEIEGQLASLQKAKENNLDDQDLLALVTDLRNKQTTENTTADISTSLDNQLIQLADREQELLEHFGPQHPRVATVRRRIAAARQLLALPSTAYIQDPIDPADQSAPRSDTEAVQLYTLSLKQELDRIVASEKLLTDLYQKEHDVAKELSGYQLKDEGYRRNIDRTQQLYDGIISQLQEASLVKGYGGFEAQVIAQPEWGEQVSPSDKLAAVGSILGGLCLGFVIAVFAEVRDKRFHSRQEVHARLGVPVFAEIPHFDAASESERAAAGNSASLDGMVCVHFQRRSPQSEAFRSLRTTVLINHRSADCRVIQLTSPSPDEGKSTVAANLAVSLAQLGRRVLLIDGDLRRPRQHQIFGVTPDKGLVSAIISNEQPQNAIHKTDVEGLWLLPVGPAGSEGSELFTSNAFVNLLASVRTEYDYVLIDSGPLLAISDPSVIASQADGVLLVIKPTKDSRWRAERAMELFGSIEIEPVGVVVNDTGGAAARGYAAGLGGYDKAYREA
jgi:capsular exopolysaccharide synthesis family protein